MNMSVAILNTFSGKTVRWKTMMVLTKLQLTVDCYKEAQVYFCISTEDVSLFVDSSHQGFFFYLMRSKSRKNRTDRIGDEIQIHIPCFLPNQSHFAGSN